MKLRHKDYYDLLPKIDFWARRNCSATRFLVILLVNLHCSHRRGWIATYTFWRRQAGLITYQTIKWTKILLVALTNYYIDCSCGICYHVTCTSHVTSRASAHDRLSTLYILSIIDFTLVSNTLRDFCYSLLPYYYYVTTTTTTSVLRQTARLV